MQNHHSYHKAAWALALLTLPAAAARAQVQLTDVSAAAGLAEDHYESATRHSLGVNWIDYNRDGWADLFLVGGSPPYAPRLFHNNGDGTFTRLDSHLPALPEVEMSGSVFADYDGDGDDNLFLYTDQADFGGFDPNAPDGPLELLLKNLWVESGGALPQATPLFEEVAGPAGVADAADPPLGALPGHRSKTAGWLDYDRDGCIDLYVGRLVMNAGGSPANQDRLYRGRCDGTFEDVTAVVNPGTDPTTYRAALAFLAAHLDDDLWPDLYVVNVSNSDPQPYINDLIYRNDGDGSFTEISGLMPGVGNDSQAGMGLDVADIDHDGDWDLYISDLTNTTLDQEPLGNVFYLGSGDGTFADNSAPAAGVEGAPSWGVNFFDVDHDTFEDIFVSSMGNAGTEMLYMNNGDGTFTNIGNTVGIDTDDSRGSAVADYDHDGDLDLAVVDQDGPLRLYRNDTAAAGPWTQVRPLRLASTRDPTGAAVAATVRGPTLLRQVKGGSSAHSQDSLTVHFGLGAASTVETLRVRWPSGQENVLTNLLADRFLDIVEGQVELFWDGFESGDTSAWAPP